MRRLTPLAFAVAVLLVVASGCTADEPMDTADLQSSAVDTEAGEGAGDDDDGEDPGKADVRASSSTTEDSAAAGARGGDDDDDPDGDDAASEDDDDDAGTNGTGRDDTSAGSTMAASSGGSAPRTTDSPSTPTTPLWTPMVSLSASSASVGNALWVSWPADPGTGRFDYRTTVNGATTLRGSATGAVGATSGVAVTPDRGGEFCVYVRAIAVAGVTDPGWSNSAESAPACATIYGDPDPPAPMTTTTWNSTTTTAMSAGQLPAPGPGSGSYDGSGITFTWGAVSDPSFSHYGLRALHKGNVLQHAQAWGTSFYLPVDASASGQYCVGVRARPVAGSGALESERTRICVTI